MALTAALVFSLMSVTLAQVCRDVYPPQTCAKLRQYCRIPSIRFICKKTCGACSGGPVTQGPTYPPPVVPPGPPPACGIPAQQGRVIAGVDAKPGAWPWQIGMFINGRFACGGSLVTPEWIVTAAHCVARNTNPSIYTIVLGAQDLRRREPSWQVHKVSRVVYHPQYKNLNYDIAVMKLERPVVLNNRVRTVCLPSSSEVVPVGTKCFITGWGKTRHPGSSHPILQQADLPVVSSRTCQALNGKMIPIKISNQMVCAGYGPGNRKGGCHGDSGGPFVCQTGRNGAFQLHGAVSWGSGQCTTQQAYTVFARVTSLRSWIGKYVGI